MHGRLALVAAAALFSTGGAVVKAADVAGLPLAGLRSAIAGVLLFVLLPAARRRWDRFTFAAGAAYGATMVLFVCANKLTTAAQAIFLQDTAPLFVLVLAPWLLGEKRRRGDLILLWVLGCGLACLLVDPGAATQAARAPWLGNGLALTSALTWAATILALRHFARDPATAARGAAVLVCGNLLAALVCLPWILRMPAPSAPDWGLLAYLGVVQIGCAYWLLLRGMKSVPAFEASLLLLVEPVLSPLWAWLVHGEQPGPWVWAGGVIILAATVGKAALERRSTPLPH